LPITEHSDTEPDQLPGDLRQLRRVRWRDVVDWSGESVETFESRLAALGWALVNVDPVSALRLPSGAVYELDEYDRSVSHWAWRAQASTIDENDELFVRAERTWRQYLTTATQALGTPDRSSRWDNYDFTSLYPLISDDVRLRERTPYRLAYWDFDKTRLLLWINVFTGTSTKRRPGTVALVVTVLLPHGG
jgi:hypothetical protein